MKVCSIDGCDDAVRARGWCGKHWQRWRRTGDPSRLLGRDNIVRHDQARHGSRRRFELGCRCFPCRIADNRYQRSWREGGRARVPAIEVVAHLVLLLDSGWTKAEVRREAGLGNSTLWHIMAGKVASVNSRTAEAILSLDPLGSTVMLDSGPLVAAIEATGQPVTHVLADESDRRAFYRARETGTVTDAAADGLLVRGRGLTLEEVYGHDYDEVAA